MNTTTITDIDIDRIAARTKLCMLEQAAWRATRLHRGETRAENRRHGTDAARVLVRLSDHHALRELGKLHSAAGNEHRSLTLPTIQEGMRLLPAGREFEHADKMSKYHDEHNRIVAEFLNDYDAEHAAAPHKLNGLYEESMWPSHAAVAAKFSFRTRYLSTPTDGAWADWLTESSRAAHDELRERLTEVLTRVRDRCASEGALHLTVFDNLRELTELAPDLDLTDSFAPVVDAMAPLTRMHAEVLRDDEYGRAQAADRAADILSVLGRIS
jgi:hypothetical protein